MWLCGLYSKSGRGQGRKATWLESFYSRRSSPWEDEIAHGRSFSFSQNLLRLFCEIYNGLSHEVTGWRQRMRGLPSPVGTHPHHQCLSVSFSRPRILEQGWLFCWTAKKGHFPDRTALWGWLKPVTGQDFLSILIPQRSQEQASLEHGRNRAGLHTTGPSGA